MKLTTLSTAVILSSLPSLAQSPADRAIQTLIAAQADAWNRNDAPAWAKDFTTDADFTNIRGDMVHGRPAIEKLHTFIFSGPYKQSHAVVTVDAIRYPTPTVAVVETTHVVTGFKSLPPGVAATEPGLLRTRMKYIFVDAGSGWKIIAAQNTAILPQAAPPPS